MDKEIKEVSELDREFQKGMVKSVEIALKFIRKAAESQNLEVIQQGWYFCGLVRMIIDNVGISLDKIGSSKEEIMSLAAEIFGKLPIEIKLITIARVENEDEELAPRNRKGIYFNNPEQS